MNAGVGLVEQNPRADAIRQFVDAEHGSGFTTIARPTSKGARLKPAREGRDREPRAGLAARSAGEEK
jgi:hypothetical protein